MVKKQTDSWLQSSVLRVTRVHFFYVLAYALSIVVFDSWNLVTPEGIKQRWILAAVMLVVTTILWYLARNKVTSDLYYKVISLGLIVLDIAVAAFNVYGERGMASKAVMLFAVPIIVSAVLRSRRALLATASFSTAAYFIAVISYFNDNYGEGYKIELYGVLAFYSAMFFIAAGLLGVLAHPRN